MTYSEQLAKVQVANILKKAKAGKVVSNREQKIVQAFESGEPQNGYLTQREVAAHFGVTHPAVIKWVRKGCPLTSISAVSEWLKGQSDLETSNFESAKLKKILLEVEKLELQVSQQKGELVAIEKVREKATRAGALLIAELASMANDAPGMLAGADEATIRERLEAMHVSLVQRFREALEECEHGV